QPVVTATASRFRTDIGATGTAPSFRSTDDNVRLGVSQQLYSGTNVSVSSNLDRTRSDPALTALNPAYNADVTVAVRQQLLRGLSPAVNRANLDRARLAFTRANLDFKSRALDIIQFTENAYYSVVFAREQLEVRNFSLALANRLWEEAKTRRDTGVATDLDVLQAEVGVANARRNVLLAHQSVKDTEQNLLSLIGQFELDAPLGTAKFADYDGAVPLFASSYQMAKEIQPDYLSAVAAVEQSKLDVRLAKDATKPALSVGGAVGFNGRRGSTGDAFSDAFDRQNNSWQVDLSLTYPWGRLGDKARYRQSLSVLSQQTLRVRQLEQDIELQVRTAVRAVDTNIESVKIATQASQLSQRQYELEKAKFAAGLSTSRRVLESQNDLETARVNELQSRVSLSTSLAALHRIEGSSLQRYGVTLP
ncbi:MAG: TolC family protein, partial [Opitutae bacterium]|nr:TolC family protein [Opitutae bacterium]